MKISMFVVIFLLVGAFFIISNNNLHLSKSEDVASFSHYYSKWIGSIANNTIGSVGYVIKMNWLPEKKVEVKNVEETGKSEGAEEELG